MEREIGKDGVYREVTRHKQDDFTKIRTSIQGEIKQYRQG